MATTRANAPRPAGRFHRLNTCSSSSSNNRHGGHTRARVKGPWCRRNNSTTSRNAIKYRPGQIQGEARHPRATTRTGRHHETPRRDSMEEALPRLP